MGAPVLTMVSEVMMNNTLIKNNTMLIKHITAFAAVAIVTLLAGCTKSSIEESGPNDGLADLELSYVGASETRAAIDGTTFPRTGKIGLFLFKDEAATAPYATSGCKNVEYSYNNGSKKWTASPSIKVGSDSGYLYGYYPYSGTATNIKAIPVSSSLNGDDVMYAAKQAAITDKTASNTAITMNHALARVAIKVINNGYTGNAKLSQIKFEGAEIAASGTLDATSGSITATKAEDVALSVPDTLQVIAQGDGTTYECLLVPSGDISSRQAVNLTLTIDDKDKTVSLSSDDGIIIAQGTKSNITITLSDSGISVRTVSIENWNVVEVSGYNVTVTLDGDTDGIERDVWTMAYKYEGAVKIEAFSKSGKSLGCYITGGASCTTAKSDNIYTFTVSGISSDVTATVDYQRPTGLSLSKPDLTVDAGCSFRLSATVKPDDTYYKTYTWTSNNQEVATVDEESGRVTAKAAGTAEITATAVKGGVTETCVLTVEQYDPALPKEFSVGPAGENCKKVRFSRGNLRYTTDIESWWFFDKQYESGHGADQLSLFTWGYGDWSMSKDTTAYESGNFIDWGTQVGDGNTWRTLTSEEWTYLFTDRTDAADKVGFATVCGNKGIIVLPDEFEDPKTNESTSSDCEGKEFVPKSSTDWDQNVYTAGESWDKMEAAGALFLPAAGYRGGADIISGSGQYWSSSAGILSSASFMLFIDSILWPSQADSRGTGRSVRLVTEVK